MKMMRTTVLQSIKVFVALQLLIFLSYFYSFESFINIEIAFMSAFLVIVGSSYAYKKMVEQKVANGEYEEQGDDLLDSIDDKHGLYDESQINNIPVEELDLKAIVKEEKAKIKTFSLSSMKYAAKAGFSLHRLVPYLFLILGFIALKNNALLALEFYLPALLVGIISGNIVSRQLS